MRTSDIQGSGIAEQSANAKVVALKTAHVTRYVLNPVLRHEAAVLVKLRGMYVAFVSRNIFVYFVRNLFAFFIRIIYAFFICTILVSSQVMRLENN